MPAYLKLLNDTPTAWKCRVSIDEQYFAFVGLIFSIIGFFVFLVTAATWATGGKYTTVLISATVLSLLGALADIGGTTVAITGAKLSVKSADKGYQAIPVNDFEVWKYNKFTPIWLQAKCTHASKPVGQHVEMLEFTMYRLSPGRTSNKPNEYSLQKYLDEIGGPEKVSIPVGSTDQYFAAVDARQENATLAELREVLQKVQSANTPIADTTVSTPSFEELRRSFRASEATKRA